MSLIIKNIKGLIQAYQKPPAIKCGKEMLQLAILEDAFLYIKDGVIIDFGQMSEISDNFHAKKTINAEGRFVMPTYIDSHTHIVFPAYREKEFVLKIKGTSYEEIAKKGGGILNSASLLNQTSETQLIESAKIRLDEIVRLGTGAVEIKSGYGLTVEGELKMLRVIKKLKEISPIPIKSTFLGAHSVPIDYKSNKSAYIDLIIKEMLPQIAKENLADYIDIFIEKGFYDINEAHKILEAGAKFGLKPKIHVEQLSDMGGVDVGIQHNAITVDHLENIGNDGIQALINSSTIPTLLPSCSFYLNMKFPPARQLIEAGLPVSIASDYNPGSSPSGNLNFSMSLACIKMKMMPEEAINAVTVNAAYALEMQDSVGSIVRGYKANIIITKPISSYEYIPYTFGNHVVDEVILNGEIYDGL